MNSMALPSDATNPEYELLDIPGYDSLQIAVLPRLRRIDTEDQSTHHYYDWMVVVGTLLLPALSVPLYGWYAESSRRTGTDISNSLQTAGRIEHSELYLVVPLGPYLASFNNALQTGQKISEIVITRFSKINNIPLPVQVITFGDCHLTTVQQIEERILVGFRITVKAVVCTAFSQEGGVGPVPIPIGVGAFKVNFRTGKFIAI